MKPKASSTASRRLVALAVVFLLAAAGLILVERARIYDWLRLYNYQPPAAIAQLAQDDTMTAYAQHVYYVNHPQLDARSAFASYCPSGTEQTVVLGCYHPNQAGIFLLQVTDPQLAGIEQVTAAHETLHGIYGRLSSAERTKVDTMLENYYSHGLTDPLIRQTIDAYKQSEPHDMVNEMHSIFGTEATNLPPDLETYYKQYFSDRAKVTGYYLAYQSAFSSRQATIVQDDAQLKAYKAQLDTLEASIQSQQASLASMRGNLQTEANNPAAYNRDAAAYNQAVGRYNHDVASAKALIARYNQLVGARNAIALEEQQLVQAISDKPATLQ